MVSFLNRKSHLYLHTSSSATYKLRYRLREVNASSETSRWLLLFFSNTLTSSSLVTAGDHIQLLHSEKSGYISTFVPRGTTANSKDADLQVMLRVSKHTERSNNRRQAHAHSVFLIERHQPLAGGCLKYGEHFRLKHVLSGHYLSCRPQILPDDPTGKAVHLCAWFFLCFYFFISSRCISGGTS